MRIDLHCHTTASDGALAPAALLDRAEASGIGLLAITDHDCIDGYLAADAHRRDRQLAVRLLPGVEFSCRWSGMTVHVVGLGVDPAHPALAEGLATLALARRRRLGKIASRLAARGFDGALDGALEEAGDSQPGRPHFAAWMVRRGHVRDEQEAFDRYLGQGRPGDVKCFWPELETAVGWIVAAGGVPVLAHPLKYRLTRARLRRLTAAFAAAGGTALEILSGRQTRDQQAALVRLGEEFRLEASVGSDFHRDHPYGPRLGVELPPPGALRGVWERWCGERQPGVDGQT